MSFPSDIIPSPMSLSIELLYSSEENYKEGVWWEAEKFEVVEISLMSKIKLPRNSDKGHMHLLFQTCEILPLTLFNTSLSERKDGSSANHSTRSKLNYRERQNTQKRQIQNDKKLSTGHQLRGSRRDMTRVITAWHIVSEWSHGQLCKIQGDSCPSLWNKVTWEGWVRTSVNTNYTIT